MTRTRGILLALRASPAANSQASASYSEPVVYIIIDH